MLMTPPPQSANSGNPLPRPQYGVSSINQQAISPLATPGQQGKPLVGQDLYGTKQLAQNTFTWQHPNQQLLQLLGQR
jgi:hypothetical protein